LNNKEEKEVDGQDKQSVSEKQSSPLRGIRLPGKGESKGVRSQVFLAASYLATGFSVLTKGPIGFFPVPVFLLFEWILFRSSVPASLSSSIFLFFRSCILKHGLLSLISIAIAAPWYLYSFSVQEHAASSFFFYENLFRFFQGMEGHTGPMFYYVIIIFLGLFPWSFFLIPYFKKEWFRTLDPKTLLFSLWTASVFVFFSFSVFKLPHYMMIALPSLACLLGKFWEEQISEEANLKVRATSLGGVTRTFRFALLWTLTLSILLIAALISLYFIRPQYASIKLIFPFVLFAGVVIIAYLQLCPMVVIPAEAGIQRFWFYLKTRLWIPAFAGMTSKKESSVFNSFMTLNFGILTLFVTFALLGLPWIERHRVTKDIALAIKNIQDPNTRVVSYHFSEPSLYIYSGKLFPDMGSVPLDSILSQPEPTAVVITKAELEQSAVESSYIIIAQKQGFAENRGEITLLLIKNVVVIQEPRLR
jgi:4-amino-4-deoxy-L-arabinose transferase-like glycosyltransferase